MPKIKGSLTDSLAKWAENKDVYQVRNTEVFCKACSKVVSTYTQSDFRGILNLFNLHFSLHVKREATLNNMKIRSFIKRV